MLGQSLKGWKIREPREPEVIEKDPRKRLREWDSFDAGRLLTLFPIYGFALLSWGYAQAYVDNVTGRCSCFCTVDALPWLGLAVYWATLGAVLTVMLFMSLLRRGRPRNPLIPTPVFVIMAVFIFFLLPISYQMSLPEIDGGNPDLGNFLSLLFTTLALLQFGIVSLHGRYLARGHGMIAYGLGMLSGFIATFFAAGEAEVLTFLTCMR